MDDGTAERWLPVVDYEGLYEISDWGRVNSLPRNTTRGGILKQATDKRGAKRVNLTKYGVQEVRLVHHLVLEAFVGPCPDGFEGCHWDGVPSNNYLSNLRWDTRESNMADMVRHGRGNVAVTHCPEDHEYTPENTYINPLGRRVCRTCMRASGLAAYYQKRATEPRYAEKANCPQCGTTFDKAWPNHRRVYCTPECAALAKKARRTA